jgi:hypothetical protein
MYCLGYIWIHQLFQEKGQIKQLALLIT